MYEFIVPEPAAFFLFATQYNLDSKVLPEKPEAPTRPGSALLWRFFGFTGDAALLSPADITRTNYLGLVRQYDAQNVESTAEWVNVREPSIVKSQTMTYPGAFSSDELKVPEGYVATEGVCLSTWTQYVDDENRAVVFKIGVQSVDAGSPPPLLMNNEQGASPSPEQDSTY